MYELCLYYWNFYDVCSLLLKSGVMKKQLN